MKAYILGILLLTLFITISCDKEYQPTYEGTWKGTNNAIYEGYFKNGKFHGKGRYTKNDGSSYDGDWVE